MLRILSRVQLVLLAQGLMGLHGDICQRCIIWGLRRDWDWWVCFQNGSPTGLWTGDLSTPPGEPFYRAACMSSQRGGWLSQTKRKNKKEAAMSFNDLASEVTHHHCRHILIIRSKSRRGVPTDSWIYFNTVAHLCPASNYSGPDKLQTKGTWTWTHRAVLHDPYGDWRAGEDLGK